ncbi:MAG TPA: bifunctional aspartate kinase/diaminopimelate decarboxylase [Thermoanaerobaculia bacterium]|nr:bifunctional aspartate kinase/diaminopimelate decarboxylase [Thermoanaerobaculia bacterium]
MPASPTSPRWVVLKLGAAALSTPERRRAAAAVARERRAEGLRPVVVLPEGTRADDAAEVAPEALSTEGSDLLAARLATALGAVRCEVWGEAPGFFTADPALLPSARLLRALDYEEAQELAAASAAPLVHPGALPVLARAGVPLHARSIDQPALPGTVVSAASPVADRQVKAIAVRRGITLVSMETAGMWREVGFLADVFARFARHGVSVDAVSSSETNVTVSLDSTAGALDAAALDALLDDLRRRCEARAIGPAAALSLVGRGIRAILHELAPVLELFAELKVHLLSQSASDLNLTVVVDEEEAERLARDLHGLLFQHTVEGALFGPTWEELHTRRRGRGARAATGREIAGDAVPWWAARREELLTLAAERGPLYVYDAAGLEAAARSLLALRAVDRVFYAVKANCHAGVLALFARLGLGFECVSAAELEHVRAVVPGLDPGRLLFTPNFARREEYEQALGAGVRVTVDNLHPLAAWPELFAGRELLLRLDPGRGRGHHAHVRTAGAQSKFGLSQGELDRVAPLLACTGARVVGLHAHAGSGIRAAEAWEETAAFLAAAAARFPELRALDVGGGLGVPERPGQRPLDLAAFDAGLGRVKAANPNLELWIEPGRYLVAGAGVLLARVAQVKEKGGVVWVGLETGMNSLIRPALYGAYHPIVNLSRLDEPATLTAHVVGPICETGDVLGRARRLAPAAEGDVFLIANAGAYGRVMSSRYNLREPAGEWLLE